MACHQASSEPLGLTRSRLSSRAITAAAKITAMGTNRMDIARRNHGLIPAARDGII
jgi:hypothetical protein